MGGVIGFYSEADRIEKWNKINMSCLGIVSFVATIFVVRSLDYDANWGLYLILLILSPFQFLLSSFLFDFDRINTDVFAGMSFLAYATHILIFPFVRKFIINPSFEYITGSGRYFVWLTCGLIILGMAYFLNGIINKFPNLKALMTGGR